MPHMEICVLLKALICKWGRPSLEMPSWLEPHKGSKQKGHQPHHTLGEQRHHQGGPLSAD